MTQTIQQRVKRESARVRIKSRIRELSNEVLALRHPRIEFAIKRHVSSVGHRLDFTRHAFLIELYCDDSQEIVVQKPTQVGVSEWAIVRVFEKAEQGLSTFYVLPKQRLRDIFVQTRIDTLLDVNYTDMLRARDDSGNMMLKMFKRRANAIFVGSNSKTELVSYPADQLIRDEVDYCDQRLLPLSEHRLDHSIHKLKIDISTPTVENFGINELYQDSDGKAWQVKCTRCGMWQGLNFFGNVLEKSAEIKGDWVAINVNGGLALTVHCVGVGCRKPIDRFMTGEYVKTREHGVSGYKLPALCHPTKTIAELYRKWQKASGNEYRRQLFMNNDLGECYTPEGANLAKNILDNCKENYTLSCIHTDYNDRCTMGIDVGKYFHVRVSRRRGRQYELVYAKKLLIDDDRSITEIISLIKRLRVRFGIIDARPEVKLSKAISELSKGVIWRCDYLTGEKPEEVFKADKESEMIKVDRTWACDEMADDYKMFRTQLPMEAHTLENGEFYEQMGAPTRMAVIGARGVPRIVWSEGTKLDHWFHASVYDKMAQLMMATINVTGNREDFQPKAGNRIFSGSSEDFGL